MANPTSNSIRALKEGEDSRLSWKTINQVVEQLNAQKSRATDLRGGITELRHKPRDTGGREIEITVCEGGEEVTYLVWARKKQVEA